MDKTETRTVIKYMKKKSMTLKEIHEDVVQILTDYSPSYAIEKKWAVEFKLVKGPQSK